MIETLAWYAIKAVAVLIAIGIPLAILLHIKLARKDREDRRRGKCNGE